jgi:hypothetical protein
MKIRGKVTHKPITPSLYETEEIKKMSSEKNSPIWQEP